MSAQYPQPESNQQTLTDGVNIDWNVLLGDSAKVVIAGDRTFNNPTGMIAGRTYILEIIQDDTGGRVPSFGDIFKWSGDVIPTPSSDPTAHDIYALFYTGGKLFGSMVGNFQLS